jgi:hypothetical protein
MVVGLDTTFLPVPAALFNKSIGFLQIPHFVLAQCRIFWIRPNHQVLASAPTATRVGIPFLKFPTAVRFRIALVVDVVPTLWL